MNDEIEVCLTIPYWAWVLLAVFAYLGTVVVVARMAWRKRWLDCPDQLAAFLLGFIWPVLLACVLVVYLLLGVSWLIFYGAERK